ncbi:hypothetical protein [Candidatus Palauibacter sp.]|uniref:hypothetical protein n=1 Tax=Candidatus Palauibacter sp. TaxID=3101350 RepID=UPI003D12C1A2
MRSILLGYALALGAAPVSGPVAGQVPERTLKHGVMIGSVDDPVYGLTRVGGVLADAERVFVLLPEDATVRVFSRGGARYIGKRFDRSPKDFTAGCRIRSVPAYRQGLWRELSCSRSLAPPRRR